MRSLLQRRVVLLLLLLVISAGIAGAGLRDIHPRPQQMGLLGPQPLALAGTPYLVIPDNPTDDEALVRDEAVRLISTRIGHAPTLVSWSRFNGQSPAIWMGLLTRFPALASALDSTGIGGIGLTTHPEEYQLVVQDGRILLGGQDGRGLRWGLMSLVNLFSDVMGQLYIDQAYIRDWPDFSKRIGTINTAVRDQSQQNYADSIANLSYSARMNELECNLIEASNRNAYPFWVSYMRGLFTRIHNRGQLVTVSADNTAHDFTTMWWQEGVPIHGTMMSVTGAGFVPVPNGYHMSVINGDFESWAGNRPTGWQMGNDSRFVFVSRDNATLHTGQSAIKFSGFNSNSPGDCEILRSVNFGANRWVKIKFWYKLSGYVGQLLVDFQKETEPYNRFDERIYRYDTPTTQDWTQGEFSFCTFNADSSFLLIGAYCPVGGTMWVDDITFETSDPVEMVRRADTPVTVRKYGHSLPLTEGIDYRIVETYTTSYPMFVKVPRFESVSGGSLSTGDTVTVDWYCGVRFQGGRQTECFSLLDPLLSYQDRIEVLDSMYHPDGFKIHINEVSFADYDDLCTARHMTPGQLVGNYCRQMYQIIQGRRPGAPVRIYGDPFDIFVDDPRAMPVAVGPWTVGALQELPSPIEMMVMQGYSHNLDSSIWYFNQNNHAATMAVQLWYPFSFFVDAAQAALRHPAECQGMQYYLWEGDCDGELDWKVKDFGDLAWNMGPFIVHTPLQFAERPDSVVMSAEMWTDAFHRTEPPMLTNKTVYYRWLPSGAFTSLPMTGTGTDFYAAVIGSVPPEATGIAYYISATDHRGQISTAPADAPQHVFTAMFGMGGTPPRGENYTLVHSTTRRISGGMLVEWVPSPGVDYYEVHSGSQPDFSTNSRTRLGRQSVACPRYLMAEDRADMDVQSVAVYAAMRRESGKPSLALRRLK